MEKELRPPGNAGADTAPDKCHIATSAGHRILPGVPVAFLGFCDTCCCILGIDVKAKREWRGGEENIREDSLICVLLWSVLLVKAEPWALLGTGCSFPPFPQRSVSADRKTWERSWERPQTRCRRSMGRAELGNEPRSCCWTIQEKQGHRGDHTSVTFPLTQQELQAAHKHWESSCWD